MGADSSSREKGNGVVPSPSPNPSPTPDDGKEKEDGGGNVYFVSELTSYLVSQVNRNLLGQRILSHAGSFEYTLQGIAIVAAIASGAGIALQNIIFGKFVTVITDFTSAVSSPSEFRDDVADLA
jgi:hypothetical protein